MTDGEVEYHVYPPDLKEPYAGIRIPGMWMFGRYVSAEVAAGLGVVFIVGRFLYFRGYVADPKARSLGFVLSFFPALILLVGGLIGAGMKLLG